MAKTLVALYPTPNHARDAIQGLRDKGDIDFDRVSVIAHNAEGEFERLTDHAPDTKVEEGNLAAEGAGAGATAGAVIGGIAGLLVGLGVFILPGVGAVVAAGPIASTLAGAGVGAATGGAIGALVGLGIPEKEAEYYAEGVRRGGVLVVVRTTDDDVDEIADVLDDAEPLDVEEVAERWRNEGWSGYDAKAEPYDAERIRAFRARHERNRPASTATAAGAGATTAAGQRGARLEVGEEREVKLPVVEEEMDIGKRPVLRGAVRVRRFVTEVPVNEKVRTREEHVEVERKAVDRPVRPGDAAFAEGTIEVTEMAEEVVVEKHARVKEEVRVRKDVEEKVETVEGTVRRADVEVEKVATGTVKGDVVQTRHVEASADKAKKRS
ncbi:MAG: YsnF/AvaK domain-containing protein [Myxococcales bacterium]|nr:YsnF/AvaK domain-containing protein [Myxococcales bacterium]